jgi:hypothetical protein
MKDLKKIFTTICWVIICFLLLSQVESKAQLKKMSAKDLTEESTAVLYGKCTKKRCEWNENKTIIYTYVNVVPEEYIKGNLGSEAIIAVPGGRVGDIVYEVSDMPIFSEGEDVLAFIWTNTSGKNLITGGSQGKMRIDKDPKTGKRMVHGSSAAIVNESEWQGFEKPDKSGKPEKAQLEDFVKKLKGYAKH